MTRKRSFKGCESVRKAGAEDRLCGQHRRGKDHDHQPDQPVYDIQSGAITVDGVDIRQISRENLRKNIAMVLQDTHLFTGTVMENIRYGSWTPRTRRWFRLRKQPPPIPLSAVCRMGTTPCWRRRGQFKPGTAAAVKHCKGGHLQAPILILDEATSSVDTRTEKHIEHGMDRLMADRTTFVIAHRLSTVRNANAIMVLEHGEIIERGDHDELLKLKGRYYELYTG